MPRYARHTPVHVRYQHCIARRLSGRICRAFTLYSKAPTFSRNPAGSCIYAIVSTGAEEHTEQMNAIMSLDGVSFITNNLGLLQPKPLRLAKGSITRVS